MTQLESHKVSKRQSTTSGEAEKDRILQEKELELQKMQEMIAQMQLQLQVQVSADLKIYRCLIEKNISLTFLWLNIVK